MKDYEVTGIKLRVATGAIIGLTEAQAAPRKHCLLATGDKGIYEVISPIEFKRGEKIRIRAEQKAELADLSEAKKLSDKKTAAAVGLV
jgi:hypothetical protein